MDAIDPRTLRATKDSLHRLAEHLLAGDLHRRTGKIGLRIAPGGFGQPEVAGPDGRHRLRIDGGSLVVLAGDAERWVPLTTAREVAAAAGEVLAAPDLGGEPETTIDPEGPLDIDLGAAEALAGWFAMVADALEQVRREHASDGPSIVQLWPEHFDVACTISEVNLGGSPGDAGHDEPYLYVGPWNLPSEGGFWNEAFGASRSWREVPDAAAAVRFFEAGLHHATQSATPDPQASAPVPAPPQPPYSSVRQTDAMVFTAGILGRVDGVLVEGGAGPELHQALRNLDDLLTGSGASTSDVVRLVVYLTDVADMAVLDEEFRAAFAEPRPARTTVVVADLPGGASVEIEATAAR